MLTFKFSLVCFSRSRGAYIAEMNKAFAPKVIGGIPFYSSNRFQEVVGQPFSYGIVRNRFYNYNLEVQIPPKEEVIVPAFSGLFAKNSDAFAGNVYQLSNSSLGDINSNNRSILEEKVKVILIAINSEHLNIPDDTKPLAILHSLLSTAFNKKGEKHALYNVLCSVGGNYKGANRIGLSAIESELPEEMRELLSLTNAQEMSTNTRETLASKLFELSKGINLNSIAKENNIDLSISFNDGNKEVAKLCHQKDGDFILTYNGQSFICDYKTVLNEFGWGRGLLTSFSGQVADFTFFFNQYHYMFRILKHNGNFSNEMKPELDRLLIYIDNLKTNNRLTDQQKIDAVELEIIRINLLFSERTKSYIPVLSADPAHSRYLKSLRSKLLDNTKLGESDSQTEELVSRLSDKGLEDICESFDNNLVRRSDNPTKNQINLTQEQIDEIIKKNV